MALAFRVCVCVCRHLCVCGWRLRVRGHYLNLTGSLFLGTWTWCSVPILVLMQNSVCWLHDAAVAVLSPRGVLPGIYTIARITLQQIFDFHGACVHPPCLNVSANIPWSCLPHSSTTQLLCSSLCCNAEDKTKTKIYGQHADNDHDKVPLAFDWPIRARILVVYVSTKPLKAHR